MVRHDLFVTITQVVLYPINLNQNIMKYTIACMVKFCIVSLYKQSSKLHWEMDNKQIGIYNYDRNNRLFCLIFVSCYGMQSPLKLPIIVLSMCCMINQKSMIS